MQIIFTNCILCIAFYAFYTIAFCVCRYYSLECTLYSYVGDCDILLTKYDFCVYSLMMAVCISQTCVTMHSRFEARGGICQIWFVDWVLKQWGEWLPAHSSTWHVIEKGEIHIHGWAR